MTEPAMDPDRGPEARPAAGMPRWVKVLGVLVLLVVLLVVVLHLTGNSLGGPGSHLGSAVSGQLW
jgi:hypothetical protein